MSKSTDVNLSLVALTPSELDNLAHLFYSTTCGRVDSSDELRTLLGKAEIALPECIQELLFSFFCGADGVVCQEFLDIARIVKSLQRATEHRRRLLPQQDAVAEEEAAECADLFQRLAGRRDAAEEEPTPSPESAHPSSSSTVSGIAISATRVPISVRDLIRSRRQQLEHRGVIAATDQTVDVEPPALSAEDRHTLQLLRRYDNALSNDAPKPLTAARSSSSVSAVFVPSLVADDEGNAEHNDLKVQRALECCFAAMHNTPSPSSATAATRSKDGLDQTAAVGENGASPSQRILHLQLRQELHEFGLVSDAQWNAPRSLASIGVDDESVGDGEKASSVWLYADPINYVPISQQQLIDLLRCTKRSHSHNDRMHSPHDDELDGEDKLDGLEHILDELRRVTRRSHSRTRTTDGEEADSAKDDSSDGMNGVVEDDPVTGETWVASADRHTPRETHAARGTVSPQDTHTLATVERDLFVSATRAKLLDEIKVFVEGQQTRTTNESRDPLAPNVFPRMQQSNHSGGNTVTPCLAAKDPLGGASQQRPQTPAATAAAQAAAVNADPFQAPQISARERMSNPSTSRGEPDHPPLETERRQPNVTAPPPPAGTPSNSQPPTSHVLTKQRFQDSKSSSSSTTGRDKVHVLQHKLRQLLSRHLSHRLHHMAQNNFPVSRKSLSASLGIGGSISSSVDTRSAMRPPPSQVVALPGSCVLHDSVDAHRQRVAYASMEAQFQREVLDISFPACDMSYQDISFTPKLSRVPLGTPLFLTCKTSRAPPPSVVPAHHRESVQVAPGILNDTQHLRRDVGYRTQASRCSSAATDDTEHHFLMPRTGTLATPTWARRLSVSPHPSNQRAASAANADVRNKTSVSPKRRGSRLQSNEKRREATAAKASAIHGTDAAQCLRRALSRALQELRCDV